MAFPTKWLGPGEDIVLDVRPHWWYLAGSVVTTAFVLAAAIAVWELRPPVLAGWAVAGLLLVTLLWMGVRYIRWTNFAFVVTTTRLIERRGVVAKVGKEIPLHALSNISYRQTFFGKLIGLGEVVIESAGKDSAEVFPDLPRPANITNQISQLLEARQPFQQPPAPLPLTLAEQLEKLGQLYREGVIDLREFEMAKAKLLSN